MKKVYKCYVAENDLKKDNRRKINVLCTILVF